MGQDCKQLVRSGLRAEQPHCSRAEPRLTVGKTAALRSGHVRQAASAQTALRRALLCRTHVSSGSACTAHLTDLCVLPWYGGGLGGLRSLLHALHLHLPATFWCLAEASGAGPGPRALQTRRTCGTSAPRTATGLWADPPRPTHNPQALRWASRAQGSSGRPRLGAACHGSRAACPSLLSVAERLHAVLGARGAASGPLSQLQHRRRREPRSRRRLPACSSARRAMAEQGASISSLWARDADLEAKIHEQEAKVGAGWAREA